MSGAIEKAVAALELLTRSANPPWRPPQAVRGTRGETLRLPAPLLTAPVSGAYLRGIDGAAITSTDWRHCDLRGTLTVPPPLQRQHGVDLATLSQHTPVHLLPPKRCEPSGHQGPVRAVSFAADGRLLASAGGDGTVRLWSVQSDGSARETASLFGHTDSVRAVSFAADGRLLASAGDDGAVRLWSVQPDGNARETSSLSGHKGEVNAVSFAADGRLLASAGEDGTVRLWSVQADGNSRETASLAGHQRRILAVSFAADGRLLASAGSDGTVRLWSVQANGRAREPASLSGHTDWVRAVSFAADGRLLASAGDDGAVRLWSVQADGSARETASLFGHTGQVLAVSFAADGRLLASTGADGTVRLWAPGPNGAWQPASLQVPDQLSWLQPDNPEDWIVRRADGAPFETVTRNGALLPADKLLYEWLWFTTEAGLAVPPFDVPPDWLRWSDGNRELRVSKSPIPPEVLQPWLAQQGAALSKPHDE